MLCYVPPPTTHIRHVPRGQFFMEVEGKLRGLGEGWRVGGVINLEHAFTPVLKFVVNGICVDLVYHQESWETAPKDGIEGVVTRVYSGESMRSLNGVLLSDCINGVFDTYPVAREVLRVVKEWSRRVGTYGNSLGFLGGVNYALLVAFVVMRYPTVTDEAGCLEKFFGVWARWDWSVPVVLAKVEKEWSAGRVVGQCSVWDINNPRDKRQCMPIITPLYPSMNSAFNVAEPQRRRMISEFKKAAKTVTDVIDPEKPTGWNELFETENFFRGYSNFVEVSRWQARNEERPATVRPRTLSHTHTHHTGSDHGGQRGDVQAVAGVC